MRSLLVTGSSGLIGSESVTHFDACGWAVHGLDNNMRRDFFGPDGDTTWNLRRLQAVTRNFTHHALDIRDRAAVRQLVEAVRPDFVIHCAAQPSHDLAASRPFDDFDVNAGGTMNLLEAVRKVRPDAVFAHLSTNKVYGDAPNEIRLKELPTRWDYDDPRFAGGIAEDFRIDQSKHSLFGASKVAADVMVQEYGRYFGMKTACFRGGCLTGPAHSGAELHGYLAYLIKCCRIGRPYRVFGYLGKQVRDNIHSLDVARFMAAFVAAPRAGEVYNLGGGKANSCSILEAFKIAEKFSGRAQTFTYVDQNRAGDHICYYSDLCKMRAHYPDWDITQSLEETIRQIVESWRRRRQG